MNVLEKKLRRIVQNCVLHQKYTCFISLLSLQCLKVFYREEMTTKEQMTGRLGRHCLQRQSIPFHYFRVFHFISKTLRKIKLL